MAINERHGTSDRMVHGVSGGGSEIVRYDRSGKWWLETAPNVRRQILLREAVVHALNGQAYLGKPGGKQFDAAVRRGTA